MNIRLAAGVMSVFAFCGAFAAEKALKNNFIIKIGACASRGLDEYNGSVSPKSEQEDTYGWKVINQQGKIDCFGVWDGHGGDGDTSEGQTFPAKYAQENMFEFIQQRVQRGEDVSQALKGAHADVDSGLKAFNCFKKEGTTSVVVAVDQLQKKLHMANLGDSRAYFWQDGASVVSAETIDHKVAGAEKTYIQQHNGEIYADRCYNKGLNYGLAVSRALGDFKLKYCKKEDDNTVGPVNPVPDITEHDIPDNQDSYILLTSDGVTDIVPSGAHMITLIADARDVVQGAVQQGAFDAKYGINRAQLTEQLDIRGDDDDNKKIAQFCMEAIVYGNQTSTLYGGKDTPPGKRKRRDNTTMLLVSLLYQRADRQ